MSKKIFIFPPLGSILFCELHIFPGGAELAPGIFLLIEVQIT